MFYRCIALTLREMPRSSPFIDKKTKTQTGISGVVPSIYNLSVQEAEAEGPSDILG